MKWRRTACGAAVVTLALSACGSDSDANADSGKIPDGTIKIGAIYSNSGAFAAFGPAQKAAGDAAVAQINADGGIAGHQVELVVKDDKSTPEGAVAAAQELVDAKVSAVQYIGTSPQSLQSAPVFAKAKIPAVTLLTDETFEDGTKWPYVFNNYSDAKQGVAPYGPFLKNIGKSEVAMISDTTPASAAFAGHLKENLAANSITILKEASFDPTAVDLTTEVQQLKESGADTLVAANIIGFGPLYNALRAVDWKPTIVETTAAFYDNSGALGDFADTTFATCNVGHQEGQEIPEKITAQLKAVTEKNGVAPDVIVSVLSAYDSLLQLKYAIEKNNSLDGDQIAAAMETIKDMGFSNPEWKYTFTDTEHQGWPGSNNHICTVTPLDEYGTPTVAEQSP